MTTSLYFLFPKDPAEIVWRTIKAPAPCETLLGVTTSISSRASLHNLDREWITEGDRLPGSELIAYDWVLAADQRTIVVWLKGGSPGNAYAVRFGVICGGQTLYCSAILEVTGL